MRILVIALLLASVACVSKPKPEEPASTKHSDTAPRTSVEAKEVAAEQSAAFAVEISFAKKSDKVSKAAAANLDKMLKQLGDRKVEEIKTIAWGDSEYPSPNLKKLSDEDQKLSDRRNKSLENWLKKKRGDVKVTAYNMTERPSAFENWLSTSDARVKDSLEASGIPNTDTSVKTPAKAGKAMVLVVLAK